ncbi:translation elongation factor Ts [Corynebacterium sp. 11A]|uniref:translation elongation factor Ts n=1 Tax=Corynebacterium sp. 11A TaxID=2080510 RepID=UPI00124C6EB2|nr:translation elongation factor Ts [Corynebacterium sp. 11A]
MANYSAADVKKLRELTGSGMMDCKKALSETDGDFDKAVELLRIKGAKDVGKRAERTAAEGLIAVSGATMIEVNSETDFVAKNAEFKEFAAKVADAAAAVKANSAEELNNAPLDGSTAGEAIQELSAKIGEKLLLSSAVTLEGENIAVYKHQRAADLPPAVGVLVAYTGEGEAAEQAAHAAAMQVAAMKAQYLNRDEVPADIVESERATQEKITREEGKPEQAIAKIVEGRMNGFYKDVVLEDQASVSDNKKTVKQVMDEAGVKLTGFARLEVGQHSS